MKIVCMFFKNLLSISLCIRLFLRMLMISLMAFDRSTFLVERCLLAHKHANIHMYIEKKFRFFIRIANTHRIECLHAPQKGFYL